MSIKPSSLGPPLCWSSPVGSARFSVRFRTLASASERQSCAPCFTGVVSLISLAVLSFERYSTMMTPTEADSSNYCKVCLGITLSWVYSLVWTVPPLFGWSSYGPEGPGTTCSVNWTAKTANSISYIICLFVFCLIVPFLVIVFCYGKLLCAIRQVSQRVFVLITLGNIPRSSLR